MNSNLVAPVGVLGFGVEGQSTFNYLVRNGIKEIVVMDKNPVNLPEVPAATNVKVCSGENYLDGLKDCVTVVRSAGVYPMRHHPARKVLPIHGKHAILTMQE